MPRLVPVNDRVLRRKWFRTALPPLSPPPPSAASPAASSAASPPASSTTYAPTSVPASTPSANPTRPPDDARRLIVVFVLVRVLEPARRPMPLMSLSLLLRQHEWWQLERRKREQ